jgi:RNA polymerase sigma-70 factor (ECF subfamily)
VVALQPTSSPEKAPEPLELIARARSGDSEAFCELCLPLEARLYRQALAVCHDERMAEELAQDTLLQAWKSIRNFRGNSRLFTWICAILLNCHRNAIRARKRFWLFETLENQDTVAVATDLAGEESEPEKTLRECLDRLPRKQRDVVYLRFYAEDSLEGIAAALGCSVGTVKSRLFRGLEKLRAMKAARDLRSR